MILTCGITHSDPRSEAIVKVLREQAGYKMPDGCGRSLDLRDGLQQAITFRCVECGAWLCKPCILRHFDATKHDMAAV